MAKAKDKARKKLESIKLEHLTIEYVPTDSIKPNSYNPNRQAEHEFELLMKSMRTDGFTQPVIALRDGRVIVDGEHRWRAAHAIGLEEIPVVFVDMTPEQMRVSTLRHNRARGSEDAELAAVLLQDLKQLEADNDIADALGLTVDEINQLVADFSHPQVLEQPEVIEAQETGDTVAIQNARRAAAIKLDDQKREEDVMQKARDKDVFRVNFTLVGEEATVVRRVLGDEPAVMLLTMCREELQAMEA